MARTFDEIQHIYDARNRTKEEFGHFWNRVCSKLEEDGNATAYRLRKVRDVQSLQNQPAAPVSELPALAAAWAELEPVLLAPDALFRVADLDASIKQVTVPRTQPVWGISVSDILEIAIAYWIEASNAHREKSRDRAMFCLMEMNYYLGMANSPTTASEHQRDTGKQQGGRARSEVEKAALETVSSYKPPKGTRHMDFVYAQVAVQMMQNPKYRKSLQALEKLITKNTTEGFGDLLPQVLESWASNPADHPGLHQEFKRISALITSS